YFVQLRIAKVNTKDTDNFLQHLADDDIDTVVQPDIMVFCDERKVLVRRPRGAPELVVEYCPFHIEVGQNDKFRRYEQAGVRASTG
ncbi:MAG: Uma2 family endonuclease, partial [Marinilabiliales bacterium]|nr:Uma2 family endonuclease [Marinilabiliales bacterium]